MIRRAEERVVEIRHNVRGGNGDAVFAHVWESTKGQLPENMRLYSVITLKKGESIGYHVHENEAELYFILSGKGKYNDNGSECMLFPGDGTVTKSGEGHSIEGAGDDDLVLLAMIITVSP